MLGGRTPVAGRARRATSVGGERVGDVPAGRGRWRRRRRPRRPLGRRARSPSRPARRSAARTSTSPLGARRAVDVAADGRDLVGRRGTGDARGPAARVAEHRAAVAVLGLTRAAAPARSSAGRGSTARSRSGSNATTVASARGAVGRDRPSVARLAGRRRGRWSRRDRAPTTNPLPSWMRPHASPSTFTVDARPASTVAGSMPVAAGGGPGRARAERVEDPREGRSPTSRRSVGERVGRRRADVVDDAGRSPSRGPGGRPARARRPGPAQQPDGDEHAERRPPTRAADRVDPAEARPAGRRRRRRLPTTRPSAWPRNAPARSDGDRRRASWPRPVGPSTRVEHARAGARAAMHDAERRAPIHDDARGPGSPRR